MARFYSHKWGQAPERVLTPFLIALCFFLSSCGGNKAPDGSPAQAAPISRQAFQLDTFITLTLYDTQDETILDEAMALLESYEDIFSRTRESSECYRLNHRLLAPVPGKADTYRLSPDLSSLLAVGQAYEKASDGAFCLTMAPLTSLWNFSSEDPSVPEPAAIEKARASSAEAKYVLNGDEITLLSEDMAFDLGAIAKGYIADRLKDLLVSRGVGSAIINLGGNVLCIGDRQDASGSRPFRVGIQKPFDSQGAYMLAVTLSDQSIVTSGIYERCFTEDEKLYHHILDPKTGYPYENDLLSVTILSDRSVDGDALSTSCFALGLTAGMQYIESLPGVYAIFITNDYQVHTSAGLQDKYTITTLNPN